MIEKMLCPSMMCADFSNLKGEVEELELADVDIFHMDIMDGVFVPNFALGLEDFKAVRSLTKKMVDVHLMISNPSEYIDLFADLGADIIYFHPETDKFPVTTIQKIKKKGKYAGIAINPETSLETLKELFGLVDYVLIMTVNPGFSGQPYLDFVTKKVEDTVELSKVFNFKVVVDGAISSEKLHELSGIGVDGFVLGTSALFGKEDSYKNIASKLRL